MSTQTLTRAWTDVDYRATLSADELAALAEHPAGDLDAELNQLVIEATAQTTYCTYWSGKPLCCC